MYSSKKHTFIYTFIILLKHRIMDNLNQESVEKIINSKQLVTAPSKVQLRVTNVHYLAEQDRYIANLAGMTNYHVSKAIEFAQEGKLQDAANQGISASLRPTDYIPSKGEIVNVNMGWVETKEGEQALLCTSLTEIPVTTTKKVSFSFASIGNPVEA